MQTCVYKANWTLWTEQQKDNGRIKQWAHSNGLLGEHATILGIAHDDPQMVAPQDCRYDTCLIISEDYCMNDDFINEGSISGGKYTVFQISHTAEAVQNAWLEIFPELRKRNQQMDETRPILERYQVKLVKEHYCEICIPIF